jgi:hypothetical protein
MTKIWLTYAWKDNEDQDVDHVIRELQKVGLEVVFDRAHIIPGQRLWPQIEKGISDPATDAWAILATENSLGSEPCREELAYALDRALGTRGADFPLIGIFPAPIERALIPSAIATRRFVILQDPNWARLVAAGAQKQKPPAATNAVTPFVAKFHNMGGQWVLEIRPRSGRWCPCVISVPKNGPLKIRAVIPGPEGRPTLDGMVITQSGESSDGRWSFVAAEHAIDALNSLYIAFEGPLNGKIAFGPFGKGEECFIINLEQISRG